MAKHILTIELDKIVKAMESIKNKDIIVNESIRDISGAITIEETKDRLSRIEKYENKHTIGRRTRSRAIRAAERVRPCIYFSVEWFDVVKNMDNAQTGKMLKQMLRDSMNNRVCGV